MSKIIHFGHDEAFARWVASKIPWMTYNSNMRAVGVSDGDTPDSPVLCAAVYMNFQAPKEINGVTWYNSVEMAFAAASPRFATKLTITNLLNIPFNGYKVSQVLVTIPSINVRAIRFVKGIGFAPRGTVAHYYAKGVHACVFGLHRNTFKSHFLKKAKRLERRPPDARRQQERISAHSA